MTTPDAIRSLTVAPVRRNTHNKGRTFPPEILRVEEVAALLDACVALRAGPTAQLAADRLRATIALLYRTGIRVSELLALEDSDLSRSEHAILIRRGKGGKRRVVLMDDWGWHELDRWLDIRQQFPPGPIICLVRGHGAGGRMADADLRRQLRLARDRANLRRRVYPHGFRHTFSAEFHRETKDLVALQRQLGHSSPTITSVYLRGIDDLEVLAPIRERRPPMMVIPSRR